MIMKLVARLTLNLFIWIRLPATHPAWLWWNGQSVQDGRSMRYHLYHEQAEHAEQDD